MSTEEKLQNISDSSSFEKIGSSVLRFKYPILSNLIESGINYKGETIKDPLDAFCQVDSSHFVMVAYTINSTNLERKWLYNTTKIKDKTPKGDLIKAIEKSKEIKNEDSTTKCTVYLVTNQRVSSELAIKVLNISRTMGVEAVIVDQSIIASFLNLDANGQYLRKIFLGIETELLSLGLLKEIITKNIKTYEAECFLTDHKVIKLKGYDEILGLHNRNSKALKLLSGDSGLGKSTISYMLFKTFIEEDKLALRIHPSIIESSDSIFKAIESQIEYEHPNLFIPKDFLTPLIKKGTLLIIDDINKENNPIGILNKLITFVSSISSGMNVSILCPVWPKNLISIENALCKEIFYETYFLDIPNSKEASDILVEGLKGSQIRLTSQEVSNIITETSRDPLLLTLSIELIKRQGEYLPTQTLEVISAFMDDKINSYSREFSCTEVFIKNCLRELGIKMISNRNLNPSYLEIKNWFEENRETFLFLDRIASKRDVFFFANNADIYFRHDRIRNYFVELGIENFVIDIIDNTKILSDPFFSEFIGKVISQKEIPDDKISKLLTINPLAIFSSLKYLQSESKNIYFNSIVENLKYWNENNKDETNISSEKRNIIWTLLNIDTKRISDITHGFPDTLELNLARFRNGDCFAGVKYLSYFKWFSPSVRNYWRDSIIEHVKSKHFQVIVSSLTKLLGKGLTEKGMVYAYQLAGFLKSDILLLPLIKSWESLENKAEDFECILWAVINCFNPHDVNLMMPVLNYWITMPDEGYEPNGLPRGNKRNIFESLGLSKWTFTQEQIKTLIKLSEDHDGLKEIVLLLLSRIDDPHALNLTITNLANRRSNIKDSFTSRIHLKEDRWDRKQNANKLSSDSLNYLLRTWQDKDENADKRYLAYRFWCGNEDKKNVIKLSKSIRKSDIHLYDYSIFCRVFAKDISVTKEYLSTLSKKPFAITWAAEIWNEELKSFFKAKSALRLYKKRPEDIFELLLQIPQTDAEELLILFWKDLKNCYHSIATALFISTEKSKKLASEEINKLGYDNWNKIKDYYACFSKGKIISNDKTESLSVNEKRNVNRLAEEFKYLYLFFGLYDNSRRDLLTLGKLNSLVPYLPLLDNMAYRGLAEHCQKSNYSELLKNSLYPYLDEDCRIEFFPTDDDILNELKKFADDYRLFHSEEYLKNFSKRNISIQRFKEILFRFIDNEPSIAYYTLGATLLEKIGDRKDVDIFENCYKRNISSEVFNFLCTDLKYNIFRNSLN